MKREDSLLSLLCFVAAAGFFALIAYNIVAGGSVISTDGLFFIVVPLVFALSFLAVPGFDVLTRVIEKRKGSSGNTASQLAPAGGATTTGLPGQRVVPALKDAKGRSMPPDVSRMVSQMKAGKEKE